MKPALITKTCSNTRFSRDLSDAAPLCLTKKRLNNLVMLCAPKKAVERLEKAGSLLAKLENEYPQVGTTFYDDLIKFWNK